MNWPAAGGADAYRFVYARVGSRGSIGRDEPELSQRFYLDADTRSLSKPRSQS